MHPATPNELARADLAVERHPSPFPARAWWGDHLLAESSAAVRVEEAGQAPALYFPCKDVRFELLHDEGRQTTCPVKGMADLWSIDEEAYPITGGPTRRDDWSSGEGAAPDGHDVLWSFTEPATGVDWLAGHAAFDHDRVRVELLDQCPGDDPRDRTVKRFPTWGDAADLVGLLDVQPVGDGSYLSAARSDWRRPVVEGSQMLGQALVAACRHSGGRRPVSAHIVLIRAADAAQPLHFELEEITAGRTFTTVAVQVTQSGRRCATATVLLDVTAPDIIRHSVDPPDGPGPYDSPPFDMSVTGRDLRIVDAAYTGDPDAPIGPPVLDAWVRFREVPEEQSLHVGLVAQFTGHLSIAAAMRPHPGVGQQQAHRSLSTAINAIAISFHGDVAADRWLLYRHLSTFAGDGMTHSECRVHDEDGGLVASFTVDAMVRGFAAAPGAGLPDTYDDRTAL